MSSSTFMLVILEAAKCGIALYAIIILAKISISLDRFVEVKPAKGRQLKYIKDHFRWLIGLTMLAILGGIFAIWLLSEFVEWKENYTQLWKDKAEIERKIDTLWMQ